MNYFDTDNRKFAKEFVDYGVFSTDDTLPYKASEESAMGEYVHPLKDMRSIKLHKIKDKRIDSMNNNNIRLTESQLHKVIRKCVNEALNNYPNNDESNFKTMDRINGYEVDYSDNLVKDVENALDAYEKFSDALDDLFSHHDIDEIKGLKLKRNGGYTTQALVNAYQKLKFA